MSTKLVLFVVAHKGYQPVEYATPKKLLEQAGYKVVTASDQAGTSTATDDSETPVDIVLSKVNMDHYDGIFFIGGSGSLEHLDNQTSYNLIKKANAVHKVIGAICVATRILAKSGVLTGKSATGWNGDNELGAIYRQYNVNYVHEDVVVDDTIITAVGPEAAEKYGQNCLSLLQAQGSWE